jgi:5-methyltetrahydrofolate--homocysteine methyltransferase
MKNIIDKLKDKKVLVADGAMGSLLMQKGLKTGECPELLNLTNPDILAEIATEYLNAGADIIQTNSFGGSILKLNDFDLGDNSREINEDAARIVSEVLNGKAYVSGSVGPTGKMLEPFGDTTPGEMLDGFKIQVSGLISGGADLICIETMTDINEALLAIEASKLVDSSIPIMATMTFNKTGDEYFTMMGVSIEAAVEGLSNAGADILGSNCGNGIDKMIEIAKKYKSLTDKPIIIQSNAGLPEIKDGKLFYPETPQYFAERANEMFKIGISIVGGCCGTTPEYIKTIRGYANLFNQDR